MDRRAVLLFVAVSFAFFSIYLLFSASSDDSAASPHSSSTHSSYTGTAKPPTHNSHPCPYATQLGLKGVDINSVPNPHKDKGNPLHDAYLAKLKASGVSSTGGAEVTSSTGAQDSLPHAQPSAYDYSPPIPEALKHRTEL